LHFGIVIFWNQNVGAKGERKMLMKLTIGLDLGKKDESGLFLSHL